MAVKGDGHVRQVDRGQAVAAGQLDDKALPQGHATHHHRLVLNHSQHLK